MNKIFFKGSFNKKGRKEETAKIEKLRIQQKILDWNNDN